MADIVNHLKQEYSDWLLTGRPRGQISSPGRSKIFLLSMSFRPVVGPTQPSIQWIPGTVSPVVKRPGHEADHSSLRSAKVNNTWIYTSTPPNVFMAKCLC
jgi:hypothetical protein